MGKTDRTQAEKETELITTAAMGFAPSAAVFRLPFIPEPRLEHVERELPCFALTAF